MTLTLELEHQADKAPIGGIVGRNPCPSCSRPPHYVAGIVLSQDPERCFLVCWPCRQVRAIVWGSRRWGGPWQTVRRLPTNRKVHDDAE